MLQTADNVRSLDLGFSVSDDDRMSHYDNQPAFNVLDVQFPPLSDDQSSHPSSLPGLHEDDMLDLGFHLESEAEGDVLDMGFASGSRDEGEPLDLGFNIDCTSGPADNSL